MTASEVFYLSDYDFPDYSGRSAPERVDRVLYFRLDGIGDAVLSTPLLGAIKAKHPGAELTVVCDSLCEGLFGRSPHVDRVVALNKYRLGTKEYFNRAVRMAASCKADIAYNLVRSNNFTGFALSLLSGAPLVLAGNDCCCIDEAGRRFFEARALRVLSVPEGWTLETEKYRSFLEQLGEPADAYVPELWLDARDEEEAATAWADSGFEPENTIVLFASGGWPVRDYPFFGEALAPVCRRHGLSVLALGGGERETLVNEYCAAVLRDAGVPALNLCGRLSVTASAALLRRCRLAVGTETGLAHMACVFGVPQAIVLGGGHFGRFMPYSPLTTAVSLPLSCYRCNWHCPHAEPYCITGVRPGTVERAVEAVLAESAESAGSVGSAGPAEAPRFGALLLQSPSSWPAEKGRAENGRTEEKRPRWRSPQDFIGWCRARCDGRDDCLAVRTI